MRRYESWLGGGPEVIFSMFNVNASGVSDKRISEQPVGGPASSGFDVNWSMFQWNRSDPKVFTIALNEYDPGGSGSLELSLGLTAKTPKVLGVELSTTFGIKGTINFTSNDEYIGTGYLYYWNNADGKAVQCGPYCKATFVSSPE